MNNIYKLFLISLLFLPLQCLYAGEQPSPIGLWRTIDDVTGKPKAIVQIYESPNKQLYGKILKIFPRPGYDQNAVCEACEGERHNQRIVGMTFLESLKRNAKNTIEWSGGKILDPKNGKSYNCNLQIADGGQKLNVRGFVGLPLFGRSQTWLKEPAPERA